ncbi:MAG: histidine phosphatase family protein [Pseudomonadota bacterium]
MIWWIRHGPTHARGMVGWSDINADLSDAAAISRLRASLPHSATLVSSDLKRTIQTANALCLDAVRLAPSADLRELNFGAWELRTHDEIEAEDPDRIRSFWETPGAVTPPGGESWDTLSARVETAVQGLLAEHDQIIAVAHFGVILSQVQRAMGWQGKEAFAQRIEPLSLTCITYGPERCAGPINHRP